MHKIIHGNPRASFSILTFDKGTINLVADRGFLSGSLYVKQTMEIMAYHRGNVNKRDEVLRMPKASIYMARHAESGLIRLHGREFLSCFLNDV